MKRYWCVACVRFVYVCVAMIQTARIAATPQGCASGCATGHAHPNTHLDIQAPAPQLQLLSRAQQLSAPPVVMHDLAPAHVHLGPSRAGSVCVCAGRPTWVGARQLRPPALLCCASGASTAAVGLAGRLKRGVRGVTRSGSAAARARVEANHAGSEWWTVRHGVYHVVWGGCRALFKGAGQQQDVTPTGPDRCVRCVPQSRERSCPAPLTLHSPTHNQFRPHRREPTSICNLLLPPRTRPHLCASCLSTAVPGGAATPAAHHVGHRGWQ